MAWTEKLKDKTSNFSRISEAVYTQNLLKNAKSATFLGQSLTLGITLGLGYETAKGKQITYATKKGKKERFLWKLKTCPESARNTFFLENLKKYFAGFVSNICDFFKKKVTSKHSKAAEQ